jgi:hypothetical protein
LNNLEIIGAAIETEATNVVPQLVVRRPVSSLISMTTHQDFAFQRLLAAWRRREDARSTGNHTDLANARTALDSARNDMHASLSGLR